MSDSVLVTKFIPAYSGNYTKNRAAQGGRISEITIHHCAANNTIEELGRLWQNPNRAGSSHYGVQHGNVGQYVTEADVAWTNSNWVANCRAVTIETANSGAAPSWPVAGDTLDTLIRLVADIARRNGLGTLVPGQNLTWHSMYVATACPGPYLMGKMEYIANQANIINGSGEQAPPLPELPPGDGLCRVQVGAFKSQVNAENYANALCARKYKAIVKLGDDGWYRVQVGAFAAKSNAEAYAGAMRAAGYNAIITEDTK